VSWKSSESSPLSSDAGAAGVSAGTADIGADDSVSLPAIASSAAYDVFAMRSMRAIAANATRKMRTRRRGFTVVPLSFAIVFSPSPDSSVRHDYVG
jgi:hypothetical protein